MAGAADARSRGGGRGGSSSSGTSAGGGCSGGDSGGESSRRHAVGQMAAAAEAAVSPERALFWQHMAAGAAAGVVEHCTMVRGSRACPHCALSLPLSRARATTARGCAWPLCLRTAPTARTRALTASDTTTPHVAHHDALSVSGGHCQDAPAGTSHRTLRRATRANSQAATSHYQARSAAGGHGRALARYAGDGGGGRARARRVFRSVRGDQARTGEARARRHRWAARVFTRGRLCNCRSGCHIDADGHSEATTAAGGWVHAENDAQHDPQRGARGILRKLPNNAHHEHTLHGALLHHVRALEARAQRR